MVLQKKKTHPYEWERYFFFGDHLSKQASKERFLRSMLNRMRLKVRRIVLISKALIQTAVRVMLVGNPVLLVPVVAVGERKLSCRCCTKDDDNRRDRIIMHIELHCRIECFQFLHHVVNANVLHNVPPGNRHFIMSFPTDVTRLKQSVTSLIIIPYFA